MYRFCQNNMLFISCDWKCRRKHISSRGRKNKMNNIVACPLIQVMQSQDIMFYME